MLGPTVVPIPLLRSELEAELQPSPNKGLRVRSSDLRDNLRDILGGAHFSLSAYWSLWGLSVDLSHLALPFIP